MLPGSNEKLALLSSVEITTSFYIILGISEKQCEKNKLGKIHSPLPPLCKLLIFLVEKTFCGPAEGLGRRSFVVGAVPYGPLTASSKASHGSTPGRQATFCLCREISATAFLILRLSAGVLQTHQRALKPSRFGFNNFRSEYRLSENRVQSFGTLSEGISFVVASAKN